MSKQMTEQERFEQMLRERKPAPEPPPFILVKGSDQNAPMFPVAKLPEVSPYTGPERIILTDVRLSWNCVARLSLQLVTMSFLVGAFIAGLAYLVYGLATAIAYLPQSMPPK